MTIAPASVRNRILSGLSASDFALLADHLEPVVCPLAMVVCLPGALLTQILFPETAIVSIVVETPNGRSAEGGLVGSEGFAPTSMVFGDTRYPHRVEIQIAGTGLRIPFAALDTAFRASPTLQDVMLRFAQALTVQTSYTAMSNAVYPVEIRLARWLLMCHDRSISDDLHLTHKFMSVMLAVRRASVTKALQSLQTMGFIVAERGYVLIIKRAALEEYAKDAYGVPEAEYRRLLGPFRTA